MEGGKVRLCWTEDTANAEYYFNVSDTRPSFVSILTAANWAVGTLRCCRSLQEGSSWRRSGEEEKLTKWNTKAESLRSWDLLMEKRVTWSLRLNPSSSPRLRQTWCGGYVGAGLWLSWQIWRKGLKMRNVTTASRTWFSCPSPPSWWCQSEFFLTIVSTKRCWRWLWRIIHNITSQDLRRQGYM